MKAIDQRLIAESLCRFFNRELEVSELDAGRCLIRLPYVDDHHDRLAFVVNTRPNGTWLITDDGFLHREVAMRTAQESPDASVWEDIAALAHSLEVAWGGGYVWKEVREADDLGEALTQLSQTVSLGLHGSARHALEPHVQFWEELKLFFDDEQIPYTRGERLVGVSQVEHRIDFALRNGALHAVQAISSEPAMRRSLNIFYDVLEASPTVVPIAFVDEAKKGYSNETFEQLAFKSRVYLWSQRAEFLGYWRRVIAHGETDFR